MTIPHVDVKAQYAPLIPELQEAFSRTLESGRFIFGPEVEAFEREAAEQLGTQDAVSCANGTDALVLVLDAMGIGPGDEVICPSFTFYATAESIARRGATPVFADIDPRHAQPRPGRRRAPDHRAHEGDHAGASLRPPRARSQRLRPAGDRGRRAGVRSSRHRDERRVDLQLLPDQEPLRARRRRPDRRQRSRARAAPQDAALPRLGGEEGVPLRRLQLAPRRDAGRVPAHLPAAHRRLESEAARGSRALHRVVGRARRDPGRRTGSRLPHVLRALARAGPARRRAARRPTSGSRSTTSRRCTCSRRCGISATPRATSRRPSTPHARISACRCGPGSPRSSRRRSSPSSSALPVSSGPDALPGQ